jgi:hypothetical protein
MLLLVAFLASLSTPAVDLPTTVVSAHLQAMSVAQALKLVSKKAGVQLSCDDSLKNDIVLLRVQEAPLRELGKQMSAALDAEWAQSSAGYVLSRSPASLKQELDDQLKFDTDAFARTQTNMKAVDQSYGEWGPEFARDLSKQMLDAQADAKATPESLHQLEIRAPVYRLFTRLMASISPEELAKLPPWGRVMYTVRPNHAQRPLPADGAQALIAFSSDQLIWADAAEPFANLNLSPGLSSAKPFRSQPAKVFLSFYRGEDRKLQSEMRIVDSGGTNLVVVDGELSPSYVPTSLPALHDPNAPVIPFAASAALWQALKSKQDLRQSGKESVLRPLLQNPETVDPLATLPADVIDSASQEVAKNLVASIPDEAFQLYETLGVQGLTRDSVWNALENLDLKGTLEGGWLRLAPARAAACHEERLDRALLAQLLQGAPDGPTHLESIEAISVSPGGTIRSPLLLDVLRLWSHSLYDQVSSIDWVALRVLASLDTDQQNSLLAGVEIHVLETSPTTQICVRELIDRGLYTNPRSTRNSIALLALQPLEQTSMLPDGVTPDVVLAGTYIATPLATAPPPSGRLASDDDTKIPLSDVVKTLAAGNPVEYGMSHILDLKVHIFPSLYSGGLLSENFYMGLAKTAPDLPEPYLHALVHYQKN